MTSLNFEHDKISPTAKLVAHWRQFSDIPFSQDVASLFKTESVYRDMFKGNSLNWRPEDIMAPLLECRYKSLAHFIKKSPIKQVLEFASGISLRGLAMTKDPDLTYIETDLPGLMQEKMKLITILMDKHKIKERDNLFFYNANVLNPSEIEKAVQPLDAKKPIIIVHEGLFQYLPKTEKSLAAKNIHGILKKFGGTWITPDFDTKAQREHSAIDPKQYKELSDMIEKITGRNFGYNSFEDDDDVQNFFYELGFNVKWQPQLCNEIGLSSLANKPSSPNITSILANLRLWVLTVRN